jgi:hypothetical protein
VYFVSEDGLRWRVGPPACTPSNCFDFECPSVFEIGGRFYMTAIAGGPGRQVYAVADRVEGPYRRPWDDTMMPGRNMSVRPCFWRGETHLFHWQRGPADWTHSIDGYCILASPKVARVEPDVTLRVESFDWSGQYRGRPVRVGPRTPCAPSCGRWTWRGDGLNTSAQDGPAIWLTRKEHEDYEVAAELTLDPRNPAREFGLVFRADETGDRGLFASCVPGRYRAELVKYVYTRRRGPDSLWRGRSVEQEFHLPPAADGRYVLRAVVFGPSIEVNVNGRLTLAHCSMPQRRGRVGLFLEDGGATFRNVSIQPLRPPTCDFQF